MQSSVYDIRWQQHKYGECIGALQLRQQVGNYHSQEYLYAYQWGLGSNVKLPYRFKEFHYEGKCETIMVKTTPVTPLLLFLGDTMVTKCKKVTWFTKIDRF